MADHWGASVITSVDGRFLWAISARDLWNRIGGKLHLNYEGVGGGVEPAESFDDAAIRECKEETGCEPELIPSPKTFVIDDIREAPKVIADVETRPFMVWRKRVRGRKTLLTYTYLAKITRTPRPKEEVPALLYARPNILLKRGITTVRELLRSGSELIETTAIPGAARIQPWGTPVYLSVLASSGRISLDALVKEAQ